MVEVEERGTRSRVMTCEMAGAKTWTHLDHVLYESLLFVLSNKFTHRYSAS